MPRRPNILMIISDQLAAKALKCYGNTFSRTPHIDSIMDAGVRFSSAYTACPLCQPARASFWTGLYPHRTGVDSNGLLQPVPTVPESVPTVGSVFAGAGYRTVHFGKKHDAGTLHGFECFPDTPQPVDDAVPAWPVNIDTRRDRKTRQQTVTFLDGYDGDEPYFAVADLNNPHDICSWIGAFRDSTPLISPGGELPPLPDNLYVDDVVFKTLPLPVQYVCCAHNRQAQMGEWDENKIRHYLAAYYHYLARVDDEIGHILAALRTRGDADNTVIVFMADHGDGMCSRWAGTKHTSFYEETARVPFAFAGPGINGAGRSVNGLASQLDLFPTLCGLAGLPAPQGLPGISLLASLQDPAAVPQRDYVASQWHTEWGFTIEPGRMIRTENFKYTRYREGDGEELYDLVADPGEVRNLAPDAAYADELQRHRKLLEEYAAQTGDPFFSLEWKADPRWRSHAPGYRNHRGQAAPEANNMGK